MPCGCMGERQISGVLRLRPRSYVARTALRACDFFRAFCECCSYKNDMSQIEAGREREEAKPAVRLRRAERRQVAMVVQCLDDIVGPTHPVRMVMADGGESGGHGLVRAAHRAGRGTGV